jgi:hypothetical protein
MRTCQHGGKTLAILKQFGVHSVIVRAQQINKDNNQEEPQMSAFDSATKFFHACDSLKGWGECEQYVAEGAAFSAQCEPLVDIKTVEDYVNWMTGFGSNTAAGCSYDLHTSAYDDANATALYFATFTGSHVGDGGPVPPTNKETNTHYVYILKMNGDEKVESMQKVWNAPWAMKELGWI